MSLNSNAVEFNNLRNEMEAKQTLLESLQKRQAEIADAQKDLAAAQQQVDAAQVVLDRTQGVLAERQAVVAQYAAAAYRDGGTLTPLTVLLEGGDPGDIIAAMGYLDAVDKHTAVVVAGVIGLFSFAFFPFFILVLWALVAGIWLLASPPVADRTMHLAEGGAAA